MIPEIASGVWAVRDFTFCVEAVRVRLSENWPVLDLSEDGVADYVIGIDNDAPQAGDFHVWVTDLAAGTTEEQIGPPYGYPIEFAHPDEGGVGPTVHFTFLPGSAPPGFGLQSMRFYAWASATEAGEAVAWEYTPDAAWLGLPPGALVP